MWLSFIKLQKITKCANIKVARASVKWLEFSLGPIMELVWADFPRQRLAQNNERRPNLLLNFMTFAKRPRYKNFFI